VHTSIPGTTDLDQLDENFKASGDRLESPDDSKVLAAHLEKHPPAVLLACAAPATGQCSKGLPVSDIIRYVSYAEGYGEFALGRENWLATSEPPGGALRRLRRVHGECPNGVHVFERVSRAQELFA
jgi:hypothetical protein